MKNALCFGGSALVALLLAGCGSGGSTSGTPTKPTPPVATTITCIDPIPAYARMQIGAVSANYACASNVDVTWSVDNSALATIASNGILTPNKTTTGTVTVTATPTGNGEPASTTVRVVNEVLYGMGGLQTVNLINADGTGETELVHGSGNPQISSDHLSFIATAVIGPKLFIYKTNGTEAGTTLSATLSWPDLGQPDDASFSPDGKTIVFRAYGGTAEKFGVYKANRDGTNLQLLSQEDACFGVCVGIGQPAYSHDGEKIVYNHVVDGQSMVCTMNSSGDEGSKSCLTPGGDGAFSSDDTTIFFSAGDGIHSVSSGGGQVSDLIVPAAGGATVSPNGEQLVFNIGSGIGISDIDGSGEKTLVGGAGHPSM